MTPFGTIYQILTTIYFTTFTDKMGDPIRFRKKYATPAQPWVTQRIQAENKIASQYGLKNKVEIWKTEALIRKYRRLARLLIGARGAEAEKKTKILVDSLSRIGLLPAAATADDVLSLELRDLLDRRIQTIVYKNGIAMSALEARQFITHGHISYKGAKHTTPGTIIPKSEEDKIVYVGPERVKPGASDSESEPILAGGAVAVAAAENEEGE